MSKLGYTWYPKDWGNSEAVFELTLAERGLYRELIDMAMLNDNKTVVNYKVWCRKFDVEEKELELLIEHLMVLELINYNGEDIFVPSCEARLNLVRGGKKGGKKSRKNKPTPKPFVSLGENKDKPTPNQKKLKGKENKVKQEILNSTSWIEQICMKKKLDFNICVTYLSDFLDTLELQGEIDKGEIEIKRHFINWLNIELRKETKSVKQEAGDPTTW